jgi:hypothetical protein
MAFKGLGSAMGSAAGAVMGGGVGSIPGMALGGAAGAAGADALLKGGLAAADPEFREHITAGRVARDLGVEALAGGVPAAGMGAAMKFGGPAIRAWASSGPLSTAARAVGGVSDAGGGLVAKGANMIRGSDFATDVAASMISPTYGAAQLGSLALQAPKMVSTGIPNLVAKSAESKLAQALLGEEGAANLAQGAKNMLTARPGQGVMGKIGQLNRFMRGKAEEGSARNAIGNAAEKMFAAEPTEFVKQQAAKSAFGGELPLEAADVARQNAAGVAGEKAGEMFDKLATVGRAAEEVPRAVAKLGLGLTEVGGRVAQGAGKAISTTGQLLQPFENSLYGQAGLRPLANRMAEEFYPKNKLKNFKSPTRILAEN